MFLNLKVGNSELESGKLICSRTLYGIGGDQEKLAEGSSCEKINILIICTMGPAKDTGLYQTITTTFCRVSVQGVESLWGDCRFIPADWGS